MTHSLEQRVEKLEKLVEEIINNLAPYRTLTPEKSASEPNNSPREFWIIEEPGVRCPSCFTSEEHALEFVHSKRKILHTREVSTEPDPLEDIIDYINSQFNRGSSVDERARGYNTALRNVLAKILSLQGKK